MRPLVLVVVFALACLGLFVGAPGRALAQDEPAGVDMGCSFCGARTGHYPGCRCLQPASGGGDFTASKPKEFSATLQSACPAWRRGR